MKEKRTKTRRRIIVLIEVLAILYALSNVLFAKYIYKFENEIAVTLKDASVSGSDITETPDDYLTLDAIITIQEHPEKEGTLYYRFITEEEAEEAAEKGIELIPTDEVKDIPRDPNTKDWVEYGTGENWVAEKHGYITEKNGTVYAKRVYVDGEGPIQSRKITNIIEKYAEYDAKDINDPNAHPIATYKTLKEAFLAVKNGNTIKAMRDNIPESETAILNANQTVILDLNGKTIIFDENAKKPANANLFIENHGTLTIKDSSTEAEKGKIVFKKDADAIKNDGTNATITMTDGTIQVKNGKVLSNKDGNVTITNGTLKTTNGDVIHNEGTGATITIKNGTIQTTEGKGINNKGTGANITIAGNIKTAAGDAIYNEGANAKVTINSGEIKSTDGKGINNNAKGTNVTITTTGAITAKGDAIHNEGASATIKVNGGTIQTDGIGINNKGANLTITGGTITAKGDAIHNDGTSATITINGGTVQSTAGIGIYNNVNGTNVTIATNVTVTAKGDAIYNEGASAKVTINGGTIKSTEGIGINNKGASVTITTTGAITAKGDAIHNEGASATIKVNGGTIQTDGIGINNKGANLTIAGGTITAIGDAIHNEVTSATITINGGEIKSTGGKGINNNVTGTNITMTNGTITAKGDAINNEGVSATITIKGGTIQSTEGKGINNKGANVTITAGTIKTAKGDAINNEGTSAQTIIRGGTIQSTNGNGITVKTGTLTLGENIEGQNPSRTNPSVTGSAIGVKVESGATFNFYDGKIIGASSKSIEGAVADIPANYEVVKTAGTNQETAVLQKVMIITIRKDGSNWTDRGDKIKVALYKNGVEQYSYERVNVKNGATVKWIGVDDDAIYDVYASITGANINSLVDTTVDTRDITEAEKKTVKTNATIDYYTLTVTPGANTQLTAADSKATAVPTNTPVLKGNTVTATVTANTGYHNPQIKANNQILTYNQVTDTPTEKRTATRTINETTTITSTVEPNVVTITINKDAAVWPASGMKVTLYSGSNATTHTTTVSSSGVSTATFSVVPNGTYNVYAGKDSEHKTDLIDSTLDVTIKNNNTTGTINYYSLTLTKASGIQGTGISQVNNGGSTGASVVKQYLRNGNDPQAIAIDATVKDGYTWSTWTKTEGTALTAFTQANKNQSVKMGAGKATLAASATYTAKPVITRNDYNTFSYDATAGAAYYVSTASSKPDAGSGNAQSNFELNKWTTAKSTGNLNLAAGQTYYVWVKDAVTGGNVSTNNATIAVHTITRTQGTGTTLTTKYDNNSTGTTFATTPTYVLHGTPIYASAVANSGYRNPIVKINSSGSTSSGNTTATGNVTIESSATPNIITLNINKDAGAWSNSGMKVTLYKGGTATTFTTTVSSGSQIKFNAVPNGTYDVYAGKDSATKGTAIDTGLNITINNNDQSGTINYYTLTLAIGTGINTVTNGGTSGTTAKQYLYITGGGTQQNIAIATTIKSGYAWNKWTKSGANLTKFVETTQDQTIQIGTGATTLTANATYTAMPTITRNDYNTFSYSATAGATYYVSTSSAQPNTTTNSSFKLDAWTSATSTGNLSLASGQTYYVWVKDAAGNLSTQHATIAVHKITRTEGTGTTLTTKYDNNSTGTTFATTPTYVLHGTPIWASAVLKTGYNTLVLSMGGTSQTTTGATVTANNDIAVTTTAKPNTYKITVNPNNGTYSGTTSSTTINATYDAEVNIPNPTRTGYTFQGWSTSGTNGLGNNAKQGTASGQATTSWGGSITKSTYFKNLTDQNNGTVTITANWTANKYTISVNLDGGTGVSSPGETTYDQVVNIKAPTKTGYTFAGWTATNLNTTTARRGTTTNPTETWTNGNTAVKSTYFKNLATTGTVTLKATWTANTVTIAVHKDGSNWAENSGMKFELRKSGSNAIAATASSATVTMSAVPNGTYEIWAGKNNTTSANKTTLVNSGVSVTVNDNSPSAVTVNYYSLTVSKGTGIASTTPTGTGVYLKGQQVSISATASGGYTWSKWTVSGSNPVNANTASTTVIVNAKTTLTATAVDSTAPTVTVSRTDFDTFSWTASDGVGVTGWQITETNSKPAASGSGWTTSGTLTNGSKNITKAGTYYVWAKDAAGNIGGGQSITAYTITRTQGTGSTLTIKEGNTTISVNYVLKGTTITATATANTGYHSPVAKIDNTGSSSTASKQVTANVAVASSATSNNVTITLHKNGSAYASSNMRIELRKTSTPTVVYKTVTASTASSTISVVENGTYKVYAGKSSLATTTMIDTGKTVTVSSNSPSEIVVDYYDLKVTAGTGITSVSGTGVYLTGQQANISAIIKNGYTFSQWAGSGSSPANANEAKTTVIVKANTALTATAKDITTPNVSIERVDYKTFRWTATDGVGVTKVAILTDTANTPTDSQYQTVTAETTVTQTYTINTTTEHTYYVWVKDAAGNAKSTSIKSYLVTRNQGTGTTLTTKADGTNLTTNTVVLAGTTISATAAAQSGYRTPIVQVNGSGSSSTATQTVNSSITIKSTATANVVTINVSLNNATWYYSNMNFQLKSTSHNSEIVEAAGNGAATISPVPNGTYNIYASKSKDTPDELVDTNVDITISSNDKSTTIYYYDLTIDNGHGIGYTQGTGTYVKGTSVTIRAVAAGTDAILQDDLLPIWEKMSGDNVADIYKHKTTIKVTQKTTIKATATWIKFSETKSYGLNEIFLILADYLPFNKMPSGLGFNTSNGYDVYIGDGKGLKIPTEEETNDFLAKLGNEGDPQDSYTQKWKTIIPEELQNNNNVGASGAAAMWTWCYGWDDSDVDGKLNFEISSENRNDVYNFSHTQDFYEGDRKKTTHFLWDEYFKDASKCNAYYLAAKDNLGFLWGVNTYVGGFRSAMINSTGNGLRPVIRANGNVISSYNQKKATD